MKPKIVITQEIPSLASETLRNHGFRVETISQEGPPSSDKLRGAVKGASALITLIDDKVDNAVMDSAGKGLKIIANYAVGFDNIDTQEAQKRNIVITNTPGVLTESVAEFSLALMFALGKKITPADRFVRAGKYKYWMPMGFLGEGLWGKKLGIVGLGRIGSFLAEICYYGLKMEIFYHDGRRDERFEMELKARYHELPALLKSADFVSLNVPLLPSTRHLISTDQLRLMKKTAFLINTSRGAVVDERALIKALRLGEIAGAGLDVFEFEPKVSRELTKMENVVLTPHIASSTIQARQAMAKIAVANIIAVLTGKKPLNPIV